MSKTNTHKTGGQNMKELTRVLKIKTDILYRRIKFFTVNMISFIKCSKTRYEDPNRDFE